MLYCMVGVSVLHTTSEASRQTLLFSVKTKSVEEYLIIDTISWQQGYIYEALFDMNGDSLIHIRTTCKHVLYITVLCRSIHTTIMCMGILMFSSYKDTNQTRLALATKLTIYTPWVEAHHIIHEHKDILYTSTSYYI